MGLFDRISRVVRSNINDLVSKAEDPEKVLEQSVIDMQEDLIQLRQAVAQAIATQKRSEQQYNQNQSQANTWHQRAQLALQKGDETLARQALERKKGYMDTANTLKVQLDSQTNQVDTLKRSLIALEGKISEAKTKKNMLKARAQAAKAQEQLQSAVNNVGTSTAMAAFERMEEKVLNAEARAQAAHELAGADLESQFASLEAGSGVEDELAAMKAQLAGSSPTQASLPASETSVTDATVQQTAQPEAQSSMVDAELEELKKQLDGL